MSHFHPQSSSGDQESYGCCKFLPILFYWLFLVPEPSKPRLHSDNLRQRNKLELTVSWLTVLSRPGPPARQLGIRIVFHKRGRQKHWTNFYNSHSSFAIHCFRIPQLLVYCYKMTRLKKAFRRNIWDLSILCICIPRILKSCIFLHNRMTMKKI